MKNIIAISILLLVVSCSKKDESPTYLTESQRTELVSEPINAPSTVTPTTSILPNNNPINSTAINPEHGQPGHRCDIAVGAPLNSAPQSSTQTKTISTTPQNIQVTPQQVTSTKTAPGMNPPHGEPGHRCDIAVGAPLNSKPATNTKSNIASTVSTSTQQKTAPGMNPPHGEPGHRCDIPVGQPLNSKPANQTQNITTEESKPLPVTIAAPTED